MKINEAIARADNLRDNALSDEQKAKWINELEGKVAELQGVDAPEYTFPLVDAELLMPAPYDDIYVYYLAAMIDFYNQEPAMYQNDMTIFNSSFDEARAWWRRNNLPKGSYAEVM